MYLNTPSLQEGTVISMMRLEILKREGDFEIVEWTNMHPYALHIHLKGLLRSNIRFCYKMYVLKEVTEVA